MPATRTKRTGSSYTSEDDHDEYMPTRSKRRQRGKYLPTKARSGHTGSTGSSRRGETTSPECSLSPPPSGDDGQPTHAPFTEPITVSGIELRPTVAFDTFWRFAAERKAIDDKRRAGMPPPWTDDKLLQNYFFCNTFRVLDKGCQFLIKEVIEKGPQDPVETVFRVILWNTFTKIETWELLDRELGPITWASYAREKYRKVLSSAVSKGLTLYTGAYIKPAPHYGFGQNYMNHLVFLEGLMEQNLASRLIAAPYLANVYEYLISYPSMGPFSAYQLMLSLSYTRFLNFHPNDFIVAGPGSESGLKKLFGKSMTKGRESIEDFDTEVMRYLTESQDYHFKRLGLNFSGLGPERLPMTIADIEHTLCEVDKYCRGAHPHLKGKRTNIGRGFSRPEKARVLMPAVLPKAWDHPARRAPRIREEKVVVEKRYEVDHLHGHKDTADGRQYLVYWVGYPPSDATWEYESSLLEDAPAIVEEYNAKFGKKKGRSRK